LFESAINYKYKVKISNRRRMTVLASTTLASIMLITTSAVNILVLPTAEAQECDPRFQSCPIPGCDPSITSCPPPPPPPPPPCKEISEALDAAGDAAGEIPDAGAAVDAARDAATGASGCPPETD
jgi:hypothetical protein